MDFILEEATRVNADGVIFHPIFCSLEDIANGKVEIYCEYTIEQIKTLKYYPRSGRTYYKNVDGFRVLIDGKEVKIAYESK